MRKLRVLAYGLTVLVGVWAFGTAIARAQVTSQDPRVALADNCDPISFNAVFGPNACVGRGDTTLTEFFAVLFSPLIDTSKVFVGHPAWRFEPSYLSIRAGQTVRVTNNGGEGHTFTGVVNFGGGSFEDLNGTDVTRAPECPANPDNLAVVARGQTVEVTGLPLGPNKFMCCIHPWMRAVIDVE
jgi:plastocyanin